MKWSVTLLMSALLATSACASGIESHGEYLHTAPFPQFHTFSFAAPEGPPDGYTFTGRSAQVVEQMKPLVTADLEKKGWTAVPTGGDIIMACGAGRRDATKTTRTNWHVTFFTDETTEEHDFVEGGIVIDAYDKNNGQIWHGAARAEIDPERPNPERLRRAVGAALSRFPSHAPGGS